MSKTHNVNWCPGNEGAEGNEAQTDLHGTEHTAPYTTICTALRLQNETGNSLPNSDRAGRLYHFLARNSTLMIRRHYAE